MIHKYWKRILLRFDRSFSSNKAWKPVLWVLGFCVAWTLALWLVGLAWGVSPWHTCSHEGDSRLDEVISLIIGQSNYPVDSGMPHWYQLLVALVGTMFFTAFLISMFSNVLMNRAASHRKGYLHYYFEDHILILGGSKMLVGLLKSIAADETLKGKDVVVLSNRDAEALWDEVMPLLTDEEKKVSLIIYHGERSMEDALEYSQVELASLIYILGEDNEEEHDSINVDCWMKVGKKRSNGECKEAKCYLSLERNVSTYLFQALPKELDNAQMETTIFNRLESMSQQVLIGDDRWEECALDRGGIDANSKKYVHFVVVGMTQMGYAMATTAAHLCHFPNFKENDDKPIRTKITFIDPDADREMKFFKGRYAGLFELSHSVYREEESTVICAPNTEYGDFLDVEWEFIKGSVVDDWVRKELETWRKDEKQILTLAFCGTVPERNIAQALYLPRGFYSRLEAGVAKPVILVYQPLSDAMLSVAQEVERYQNIYPFGNITECFDKNLNRRVAAGKRINYLYDKGERYERMPDNETELDAKWSGLSFAKRMSNIYAANSIYTKYRSEKIDWHKQPIPTLEKEVVDRLARMEHSRWNMEKLLVGFSAMTKEARTNLNNRLLSNDPQEQTQAQAMCDELKDVEFIHRDIAPYDELLDSSRNFDIAIVKNLKDVIDTHKEKCK